MREITRIFVLRAKIPTACRPLNARILAFGEISHALRLVSKLPDLRAAKPNLILRRFARRASFEATSAAAKAKDTLWVSFALCKDYGKDFLRFAIRFRTLVKYNAFRPSGEKLHQHFFTIHYYLLLAKKSVHADLVKSEE